MKEKCDHSVLVDRMNLIRTYLFIRYTQFNDPTFCKDVEDYDSTEVRYNSYQYLVALFQPYPNRLEWYNWNETEKSYADNLLFLNVIRDTTPQARDKLNQLVEVIEDHLLQKYARQSSTAESTTNLVNSSCLPAEIPPVCSPTISSLSSSTVFTSSSSLGSSVANSLKCANSTSSMDTISVASSSPFVLSPYAAPFVPSSPIPSQQYVTTVKEGYMEDTPVKIIPPSSLPLSPTSTALSLSPFQALKYS